MSNVKERIGQALRRKNYFNHGKKDSMKVFDEATCLEHVIIEVERGCNDDKLFFRYDPTTHKFNRVIYTQEDRNLLQREALYNVNRTCKKRGCFSKKISVKTFVELLEYAFKPIAVYSVTELES